MIQSCVRAVRYNAPCCSRCWREARPPLTNASTCFSLVLVLSERPNSPLSLAGLRPQGAHGGKISALRFSVKRKIFTGGTCKMTRQNLRQRAVRSSNGSRRSRFCFGQCAFKRTSSAFTAIGFGSICSNCHLVSWNDTLSTVNPTQRVGEGFCGNTSASRLRTPRAATDRAQVGRAVGRRY